MLATVQNSPSFAKRAFFQERKSHSIAPKKVRFGNLKLKSTAQHNISRLDWAFVCLMSLILMRLARRTNFH